MRVRNRLRCAAMAVFCLSVLNIASVAMAAPAASVTEIDPSLASGALSVLAAGGLIFSDRLGLRRK